MTEQHTATRALTTREVVKPTPAGLMEDTGTGLDYCQNAVLAHPVLVG
ncbi:hypothetical protein Psi02_65250 [Planotetraspora silvatica]|uniref:Uncharacterized protein n=1 Tax=Planotetraspora silvatica TaxID=234614 RepID=A0A8J3UV64_9ACTN|nr:hypothetical protein [Planotetraspora silvatica]GII50101.1 hypothetical protein Psi02_65250 [Planotetraspora silvatica]